MGTGSLLIVSFTCGSCDNILGVQVNPFSVMDEQTTNIKKLLGR